MAPDACRPDWDRLYEIAATQDGHFSTPQAAAAGYSPQLLAKHIRGGRVVRIRRGINSSIQAFHAGLVANPAPQYHEAIKKRPAVEIVFNWAASTSGKKLKACNVAQMTTHGRCPCILATAQGVKSWRMAPANKGNVTNQPAAISPIPIAKANAPR